MGTVSELMLAMPCQPKTWRRGTGNPHLTQTNQSQTPTPQRIQGHLSSEAKRVFSLHTARLTSDRHRVSVRQSLTLLILPQTSKLWFLFNLRDLFILNRPIIFPNCSFPHAPKLQFSKYCPGSQRQQHLSTYCKCTLLGPRYRQQRRCWLKPTCTSLVRPQVSILFVLIDKRPARVFAHCI